MLLPFSIEGAGTETFGAAVDAEVPAAAGAVGAAPGLAVW